MRWANTIAAAFKLICYALMDHCIMNLLVFFKTKQRGQLAKFAVKRVDVRLVQVDIMMMMIDNSLIYIKP